MEFWNLLGVGDTYAGAKVIHARGCGGGAVPWRGCVRAPRVAALLGSWCKACTAWSVSFSLLHPSVWRETLRKNLLLSPLEVEHPRNLACSKLPSSCSVRGRTTGMRSGCEVSLVPLRIGR